MDNSEPKDDCFLPDGIRELFERAEAEYNFAGNAPASCILEKVSSFEDNESYTDSDEASQVNFSIRTEDDRELQLVDEFLLTGCGCSLILGASCSKLWSRKVILSTTMNCFEMSKEELDMLILGQLDAHRSCRSTDLIIEEVSCTSERC